MATYTYRPLDLTEDSIRLLRIQKGGWRDDILCQLFEACPWLTYTALSYTWGGLEHAPTGPEQLPRVVVVGHEFKPLTGNLYEAVRHIRRPDRDVTLWVDAICISQSDPREKGHQVKQMGTIYEAAEEVLIYLAGAEQRRHRMSLGVGLLDRPEGGRGPGARKH